MWSTRVGGSYESQWEEPDNQVRLKKCLKVRQQHSFQPAMAQQQEVELSALEGGASSDGRGFCVQEGGASESQ